MTVSTRLAPLLACVLLLAPLAGCGRKPGADRSAAPDTTALARRAVLGDTTSRQPPAPLHFTRALVASPARLLALRDSLGPARWRQTLRVNRVDSAHVRRGDTLIVPPAPGDTLALSGFPSVIPAVRDSDRVLLVSLRVQAFAAYDSGRLVRWGPVSTGRRTKPTPVGLFHTNWKDKQRVSTFSEEWLLRWYLNLDNFQGVSLHQYELPGHPASHSCVRLLEDDAIWLYDWAREWKVAADRRTVVQPGTPVVVFGEWAWKGRPPWKELPEDPFAATLASDEIADAMRVMTQGVRPVYVSLEEPAPLSPGRRRGADSLRTLSDTLRAVRMPAAATPDSGVRQ